MEQGGATVTVLQGGPQKVTPGGERGVGVWVLLGKRCCASLVHFALPTTVTARCMSHDRVYYCQGICAIIQALGNCSIFARMSTNA
eukprot:1145898-Pelagomonas_calceolata.AAC.5